MHPMSNISLHAISRAMWTTHHPHIICGQGAHWGLRSHRSGPHSNSQGCARGYLQDLPAGWGGKSHISNIWIINYSHQNTDQMNQEIGPLVNIPAISLQGCAKNGNTSGVYHQNLHYAGNRGTNSHHFLVPTTKRIIYKTTKGKKKWVNGLRD